MYYFFDTSALVKRYHVEEGSHIVNGIFETAGNKILIANLSMAEFASAINRKKNKGEISNEQIKVVLRKFATETILPNIVTVGITTKHITGAYDLIFEHNLTSNDAIILAACLNFIEVDPVFVCADVRSGLLKAAHDCHLSTLNPLSI